MGTSGYYCLAINCCYYKPCTAMAHVCICYAKVASRSCWVTSSRGGRVGGSTAWLASSPWCKERLMQLVEASWVRVFTMLSSSSIFFFSFPNMLICCHQITFHWNSSGAWVSPGFLQWEELLLQVSLGWRYARTVLWPMVTSEGSFYAKISEREMYYSSWSWERWRGWMSLRGVY